MSLYFQSLLFNTLALKMSIKDKRSFYILILICFISTIVSQPKIIIIEKYPKGPIERFILKRIF